MVLAPPQLVKRVRWLVAGALARELACPTRRKEHIMGFEQYHEPAAELSPQTRTFARILTSLTEEAEAIPCVGSARWRVVGRSGWRRSVVLPGSL